MDDAAFRDRLAARAAQVEAALQRLLPRMDGPGGRVAEAMRYVALSGGKRLRAFLTLECAALMGAAQDQAERAAAALECVHAYSLAHDDLPAMDDDDIRRGQPTAHIAFDEATAILAGDALQTLAFEILADPATHPAAEIRCALVSELAMAAGAEGMVGGQMLDIEAEAQAGFADRDRTEALAAVERLQALKTGRLIRAAALMGARLGGAEHAECAALRLYADRLGLAFQIRDDLIDVEGDEASAGKRLGKDDVAGKATFVGLLGVEGAGARAKRVAAEACDALAPFGASAEALRAAARFAVGRAH